MSDKNDNVLLKPLETPKNNRARDGGTPNPDTSAHYKYWNPIFNRERATHCLQTKPFNPRCGPSVCLYFDGCDHKPPETLRSFDRVCPIPFEIAEKRLNDIKQLPIYQDAFGDEAVRYASSVGKLWWAENVALAYGNIIGDLGGTTGLMVAVEGTPLHAIKVIIKQLERDIERIGNKFGFNPMFAAKLRIDILSGNSIQEQLEKQRQIDLESGTENPAYLKPAWDREDETKAIEGEVVGEENKIENPFTGEAAAVYEQVRRENQ